MKLTTSVVALILVVLLALTACAAEGAPPDSVGGSTANPAATTGPVAGSVVVKGDPNITAPGEFPIAVEREKLVVMKPQGGATQVMETNWFTEHYGKMTNIDFEFVLAPQEQFKEKANLALSAGDNIDLIIGANNGATAYSLTDQLKFGLQGIVLPLNELIDDYSVHLKGRLQENDEWRTFITAPDGNMYAFTQFSQCFHCTYYGKLFFNTSMLENLGLPLPVTTQEFEETLRAMVDKDGNGNGEKDEIGITSAIGASHMSIDGYLMCAFQYCDGEDRLYLENGVVTPSFTQDNYREGLRWIHKLYADGLIYKESFTQDRTTNQKLNSSKYESVMAAVIGPHHGYVGSREAGEEPRWFDYVPLTPLIGPNGVQTTKYDYYSAIGFAAFIPASSKKAQLATRFIDWMYSQEGSFNTFYGPEGIAWEAAAVGTPGIEGEARFQLVKGLEGDPYYGNSNWGNLPAYLTAEMRAAFAAPTGMFDKETPNAEKYLQVYTRENYEPYGETLSNLLPSLYYPVEDMQEMSMLKSTINTYVVEQVARFITGDRDLETGWDSFLKELGDMQLPRYLDIIQKTYDASSFKNK